MDSAEETDTPLRELPDPDFIAAWARARWRLALGNGSKAAYEAARAEYERRLGKAS